MNRTLIITLCIAFLVLIAGGGAFVVTATSTKKTAPNSNVAATKGTDGLEVNDDSDNPQQAQKNAAGGDGTDPTGTTQASVSATFADGLYLVGTNIAAGTYTSNGKGDCSWKRLNSLSSYQNVTATGKSNGPTTVTIQAADKAFSSTGCGTWTKQ